MTFRIGQKVVCIDPRGFENQLRLNAVYTVSAVGFEFECDFIGCAETYGSSPLHWRARRFRPMDVPKTDISIFTEMLNTKQREHEFTP